MLVTAILLLVASMFTAFYCDQVRMYKIVAFAIVYVVEADLVYLYFLVYLVYLIYLVNLVYLVYLVYLVV